MFGKFMNALKIGHRNEKGITGLETAIILIAFVTVAAVFGYAVLSAGIFSAEKGKETVYLGLEEAKSTMEIKGSIQASGDNATQLVTYIYFTVANTLAGEPIDLTEPANNKCVLTYIDQEHCQHNMTWTKTWTGYNDGDDLLEVGEKARIAVDVSSMNLGINTQFSMEFMPPVGATISFDRTTPARIDTYIDFH